MPDRIDKRVRLSKTEQRHRLFATIDELGFEVMPCSNCYARQQRGQKVECKMMDGVSRCKECVRRGISCDGSGVPMSSLNRVLLESRRLKDEEEAISERLNRLTQETQEALAKLNRLRVQRSSLVTRGAQMVNRGLQSLDELDERERQESDAVVSAHVGGAIDVIDWGSIGLGSALDASWEVDPSLLALVDQGVGGGSPPRSPGQTTGSS